ncbi:hypothetical protein BT63DRAFT_425801 [Microthyrium microscopicum]|uniref:Zn(2)-C6 fungal-type domain-containing protein n=1 Tax=Microthyrium microscopicum TaxID=703497 RepID=A0A6A6UAL4_9PEZI|nr:hypothetical protein BT63DRAFT_425801 [Microthyrium microscopicum]
MPLNHAENAEDSGPNKRRKTQLACHACRARKTGCDGRRPHCTSCVARGWERTCEYPDKISKSPAVSLLELEKRVQRLESGLGTQSEFLGQPNTTLGGVERSETTMLSLQSPENLRPHEHPPPTLERILNSDNVGPIYDLSSNNLFVRDVTSAAFASDGYEGLGSAEKSHTSHRRSSHLAIDTPVSTRRYSGDDSKHMVVPPRKLVDHLLNYYWELMHPLAPILHRPTFDAQYINLWTSDVAYSQPAQTIPNVMFNAILNMAMSVGCLDDKHYDCAHREKRASEFYLRSRKLVSLETIDQFSLPVVQLLILRALYLLRTPCAERCWTATGAAIGAAQGMGLDTMRLQSGSSDQLTREMRRRVWYGCVILDRLVSNAFGRRLRISETSTVPLPAEIDDEYLSTTTQGQKPPGTQSKITFMIQSLTLSAIADKSMSPRDRSRPVNVRDCSNLELGTILDISAEMDGFLERLPLHLKADAHSNYCDLSSCFELQAHVLKARVMYLRLQLLRPILLQQVAKRSPIEPLQADTGQTATMQVQNSLHLRICELCITAAQDVLVELHLALSGKQRTLAWHALLFTFAAASALIAATLCPDLKFQMDDDSGKASWNRAIEIFKFHSNHIPSAGKGIDALKLFRRTIAKHIAAKDSSTSSMPDTHGDNSANIAFTPVQPLVGRSNTNLEPDLPGQWSFDFDELLDSNSLDLSWFTSQTFAG